jgi:hypothetical protein
MDLGLGGGSTGKRKRRRLTRRLRGKYNHTKKKSKMTKMMKRKVTKRSRKNKQIIKTNN